MARGHKHVPLKNECFALFSECSGPTRAVVFVHGWGGSPGSTWYRFQEVVDTVTDPDVAEWWSDADLYFYSYESRRFSIAEHAEAFLRFLDQVFPLPLRTVLHSPDAPIELPGRYSELWLVGHSLGGVVLREAILDRAAQAQATTRVNVKSAVLLGGQLRLFAPAMHGAKPSGWLGLSYHLLREVREVKPFLAAAAESQTIIRQLQSESDKLKRLRDETQELAHKTAYPALVAHVVYGENEHIVERDKFRLDRISPPVNGMDHRSICKPNKDYEYPLRFVMKGSDV